jgi:hypothetical protein
MKEQAKGSNELFILLIVFVVLKLTETGVVATWSWWWVLSPMLIPIGLIVLFTLIALVINKK